MARSSPIVLRPLARACLLVAACFLLLGGAPGCRERYVVRHAASPNPLASVRTFAVEPLTFEARVEGKPEADWLAKVPDETRRSWPAGKTAMISAFGRGLVEGAKAGGLTVTDAPGPAGAPKIRAVVRHVEPGHFEGATSADTMVEVDVEIVSAEGVVIDAITSRASVPATALNLELVDRLRDAAKDVGDNVARYLRERTGT